MPLIFLGLFVSTRIVVRPRSARIWEPMPYSRASAAKLNPGRLADVAPTLAYKLTDSIAVAIEE